MNKPWNNQEIDLVVEAYLKMLADVRAGRAINKAMVTREISQATGRGRASVQFKLQNISAVLSDMGETWIPGLMPRFHYQGALALHLRERLNARQTMDETEIVPTPIPKVREGVQEAKRDAELAMTHADLKKVVIRVLHARPNQSCAKKNLISHVCKELGLQGLRGTRRARFSQALNRAVGSLKQTSPPTVREYKSSLNVRIRLATPRRADGGSAASGGTAGCSAGSAASMGLSFVAVQPYISRLLILCPECKAGFSVPFPVHEVSCHHCAWSPSIAE